MKFSVIRVGKKAVKAFATKLQSKSFVLIKGRNGYIMCGYINMDSAEKFGDVAVKVTGVSTIKDVLKSSVADSTTNAKKLGIIAGMPIKEVLKIIA